MAQKKTTNKAEKEAKEKVKTSPTVKKMSDDIQLDAALYIGEALTKVEKGTNWYKKFIDTLMADALKNPGGRCGQLLASTLFNEATLSKLGTEASKAKDDQEEYRIYQLRQTLYKEQQEVFDNQIDRNIIVICSRRAGKCFGKGTKFRKYDGSIVNVEDIKVGDILRDDQNRPTEVISLTRGRDKMYRISANVENARMSHVVNSAHILTVKRTSKDWYSYKQNEVYDIPLQEFINFPKYEQERFSLYRLRADYARVDHTIDPYLLGLWLGDGNRNDFQICVNSDDTEIRDYLEDNYNCSIYTDKRSKALSYNILGAKQYLKNLNLLKNKHIPKEYLIDSAENRLKLLAGLIDSDGYNYRNSNIEISSSNKQLADDIFELCCSLGFRVLIRNKQAKLYGIPKKISYTITIKGQLDDIPNVLTRKHASNSKQKEIYGFHIEELAEDYYYGFTLNGNGRCVLEDYTVTHNTELNARKLLKTALRRNSPCLYLNKTFANAIDQMYDLVMDLAGKLDFAVASSSKTDGMIKFTNGSSIKFGGINDIAAIDKYRGFKFRLVIVDEVGHIKNGQYLIDEVLEPATSDFTDSQMLFTGTPPRVKNFATRLWHSKIRKYHWTAIDNPFIHDFQEFIDKKCKEKGLTIDDPFIQREYYGNMEAYDTNAVVWKGYKVYKLSDILSNKVEIDANQLGHIIFHPTSAYIGVDWGGTDNNAIVSVLVDEISKHAFVYDLWVDKKTGLEVIKAEIQKAYNNAISRLKEYGIDDSDKRVHIITDTNMVEFCVDLCNLGLPVEKAKKYEMMTSVEDMGALLRTGKVLVPDNWTEDDNMLIHDFKNTVYKRDEETDELKPIIDDESYHPDAAHALRYAIRAFTGSGTWLNAKAANTSSVDPTVAPGLENLKEYGPKGAKLLDQSDGVVEEFIL